MLNSIKENRTFGAILTLVLASVIILILFSSNVFEANQVSFASGGDGLKSTFGTIYHIKYDSSYWHFEGMNYPHGESVFFTGNQTFTTNLLKLFMDWGWDLSDHAMGILNILMLFSFVLCALFLFLILVEFELPVLYSVAGALLIMFLSPQWHRLGGHYNLAYAWIIPAGIYMMIKFYRNPGYLLSVIFGIYIIIITGKHVYFMALVGLPWFVFWVFLFARARKMYGRWIHLIPHVFIQVILPFVLFSLFAGMHDTATDRTAYPWGFFASTTRLVSVFLPLMKPHGIWFNVGAVKTLGYVGLVTGTVFFLSIILLAVRWIRHGFTTAIRITDRWILNVMMVSAVICLIVALGYPFTWTPKWLNYAGPLRQLRAIGRFVIPMYYLLGIYSIYMLWYWYTRAGKRIMWVVVAIAMLVWGFEAYVHVHELTDKYSNKHENLNDRSNSLPANAWVDRHDWSGYQALMPLPYYHIGSENYWVNGLSPAIEESYFASLKTGLPLNSVMMSRTSISQTLANLDLHFEPYLEYPVLKKYHPDKPILLMQMLNADLSEAEKNLVKHSILIDSGENVKYYKLYPDSIHAILAQTRMRSSELYGASETDTACWYCSESYSDQAGGVFSGTMTGKQEFFSCTVPDSGNYTLSFWYFGAGRDLWPRTNLFISRSDTSGQIYSYRQTDFFRETVLRDDRWALVEITTEMKNPGDRIAICYQNRIVTGGEMVLDKVLLRPVDGNVIDEHAGLLNNRVRINYN